MGLFRWQQSFGGMPHSRYFMTGMPRGLIEIEAIRGLQVLNPRLRISLRKTDPRIRSPFPDS